MKRTHLVFMGKNWFARYECNGKTFEVIAPTLDECKHLAGVMIL